jgi:hypothetical protein
MINNYHAIEKYETLKIKQIKGNRKYFKDDKDS